MLLCVSNVVSDKHMVENICRAASGLKAPNVIAWGEAQTRGAPGNQPQRNQSALKVRDMVAAHCGLIISALQASGGLRNRLPGPPLAVLAPAQAIKWRAFSPEEGASSPGCHMAGLQP